MFREGSFRFPLSFFELAESIRVVRCKSKTLGLLVVDAVIVNQR